MKTVVSRNSRSFIALALLLLLAIGVFAVEIAAGDLPPLLGRFFSAVEFFLAASIGWTSQAIVAREENIKSLRQYAISAYRRITDIGFSVSRIRRLVLAQSQAGQMQGSQSLEAITAVADELTNTVRSSTLDWTDIIGEDLEKVDRIRQLRERLEVTEAALGPGQEQPVSDAKEIRAEIDRLRTDLPFLLQEASAMMDDPLPREGRYSMTVASYLRSMIDALGAITVPIRLFSRSDAEGKPPSLPEPPLHFTIDQEMFKLHLGLVTPDGRIIGEVDNPLDDAGVFRNDFVQTLLGFLPPPARGSHPGLPMVVVPNARIVRSPMKPSEFLLEISMTADLDTPPLAEDPGPEEGVRSAG